MWIVKPMQIRPKGQGTPGHWRMTATSDEDGGGPWGEETHEHETAEQAQACERCDEYMAQVTGFPSRKQRAIDTEASERAELKRLLEKYGPDHTSAANPEAK